MIKYFLNKFLSRYIFSTEPVNSSNVKYKVKELKNRLTKEDAKN